MKIVFLFIAFASILLISYAQSTCKTYKCLPSLNANKDKPLETKCSSLHTTPTSSPNPIVDLDTCPGGYTCVNAEQKGMNPNNTISCTTNTVVLNSVGEKCSNNTDCESGLTCVDNFCVGLGENQPCQMASPKCAVGLFCQVTNGSAAVCKKAADIGQVCNTTFKCVSYGICNSTTDGICIRRMGLKSGAYFNASKDLIDKQRSRMCETLYHIAVPSGGYQCVKGLTLNDSSFAANAPGLGCSYQRHDGSIFVNATQSLCGYNSKGNAYCPRGFGNIADRLSTVANYFNTGRACGEINPHCYYGYSQYSAKDRINYRRAYEHIRPESDPAPINDKQALFTRLPGDLEDNDKCVKEMINRRYWDSAAGICVGLISIIAAVFLIL